MKLENPFGFDDVDHDLEDFGGKMSLESDCIMKVSRNAEHRDPHMEEMFKPPSFGGGGGGGSGGKQAADEFVGFSGSHSRKEKEREPEREKKKAKSRLTLNPMLGASKKS